MTKHQGEGGHTPGPWAVDGCIILVGDPNSRFGQHNHYCGGIYPAGVFRGPICGIQSADHIEGGITREEAAANARLIAAAPEMFEALFEALPYVECAESDPAYKPGAVKAVSKRIRAVRGEAIRQASGPNQNRGVG